MKFLKSNFELMNDKQIQLVLSGKLPLRTKAIRFCVALKKYIISLKRGGFKGLKNIEGLEEYNISADLFSTKERKNGISGFARLRNGGEFLEQVIESHIPYLDEIILVDNNSEDNTREICEKMRKKYPKIIKIYKYEPEVYKLGTEAYANIPEDSVHDMSYYYNRVLSKTTYKYAIKIDDDHIVIPDAFGKIVKEIHESGLNVFMGLGLFNIKKINNDLFLPKNSAFSGLHGDFGFFPVSQNTYFVKDKLYENFICNLKFKYGGLCFYHLKFLKKGEGLINYEGKVKEIITSFKDLGYYRLPNKIRNDFCNLVRIK